jgi:hypothetical protein
MLYKKVLQVDNEEDKQNTSGYSHVAGCEAGGRGCLLNSVLNRAGPPVLNPQDKAIHNVEKKTSC